MKLKLKAICVISALCFLGSVACFSAVAAELLQQQSGEEETVIPADDPIAVEPAVPVDPTPAVDPVVVEPTEPGYVDQTEPVESGYVEPVEPENPGYVDNSAGEEPYEPIEPTTDGGTVDPSESVDPATYSDVISEGNFPQPVDPAEGGAAETSSVYVDNTQQYNQYIYYTQQAQYDDNYIYIPEYQEPTESLIGATSSKAIDTDELTGDDWDSIMLDLSKGNLEDVKGTQTFSFIKDNSDEGDTDMLWLVYLGTGLIIASVLLIIFVIVSTGKAKESALYA